MRCPGLNSGEFDVPEHALDPGVDSLLFEDLVKKAPSASARSSAQRPAPTDLATGRGVFLNPVNKYNIKQALSQECPLLITNSEGGGGGGPLEDSRPLE